MQWLEGASLSDSANMAYLCSQIDLKNFIDYQLFEAFIANIDWPANNMRCYQYGSAPWRWIFYDADAAFRWPKRDCDMTEYMTTYTSYPSSPAATLLFRKLLQSDTFVEQLGYRMYELAPWFSYSHTAPFLEQAADAIEAEVEYQVKRFGTPKSVRRWKESVHRSKKFLQSRPDNFFCHMEALMEVPREAVDTFRVYPNPATDRVYLQVEATASGWEKCYVYSLSGQLVATLPLYLTPRAGMYWTSVASLPAGVYLLKLQHSSQSQRLVVH